MQDGEDKMDLHLIKGRGEQDSNAGIPKLVTQKERSLPAAKVVDIASNSSVDLPDRFTRFLQEENADFVLIILTPLSKMIRLILMRNREVVKVTIEINELSTGFFKDIGPISFKYKMRILYSTGVCFYDGGCIYESYFDKSEFTLASLERLRAELNNIPGVSSTDFTILKAE